MRFQPAVLLLLCLSAALLVISKSSAVNSPLRVNEAATRVLLREGKTEVALAVENQTANPLRARIELEWLDPQDAVRNRAERIETIAPGAGKITIPLPLLIESKHEDETLWHRLRYRISPDLPSGKSFTPVAGVISLSEITPDIFELNVTASEFPFAGKLYRAHVRALHPITGRPVSGVNIAAHLKFDNDRKDSFKAGGIANSHGYLALDFNLPRDLIAEDGKLEIKATRGDFKQKAEIDLRDDHLGLSRILLTTDKPLYQPAQTLHIRALAMSFSNRAIPDAGLELKIEDPEGTTQFRADLKTSRVGVANVDWQIPDNARLGNYSINIELDDDKLGKGMVSSTVKITRYDLPNFAVKTKPDRDYYLPGQNAEVEIRGDYLFGQPVTKGHVRVVREKDRHWNYREQKWETEEAEKYEGEIDASGRFIARIDLAQAHNSFSEDRYRRFEDLTYAAYFTDATTGRTEQKRFDLRVTREAIHVYVIGLDYGQPETMPLQFYVSTSYADGSPAASEVTINEVIEKTDSARESESLAGEQLRKVKTNKLGLAKISGLQLRQRDDRGNNLRLNFIARDGKGTAGHHAESVGLRDRLALRVETDKTIYRAGEPVEVRIVASKPDAIAVLNVSCEFEVLRSQMVRLRGGKAFVVLPYQREFDDQLTISVSADDGSGESRWDRLASASRGVLYPRDRELKLDVRLGSAEYRPGEEARASFRVLDANGRPVESALGVSVVDRAVEERALADRDFSGRGRHYDFIRDYLQGYGGLAGVSVRDLRKLDPAQPISDEMQLVAEILLRDAGAGPLVETSSAYDRDQKRVFADFTQRQFKPLLAALDARFRKTTDYPRDRAGLDGILNNAEIRFADLRDPWGVAYRAQFTTLRDLDFFNVTCAGADKKFDTADDFTAATARWPYFKQTGQRIRQTMLRFNEGGGRVTLDAATFKDELKRDGLDFDALRDRWGNVYWLELGVVGARWQATVRSSGANGKFDSPYGSSDDFTVWTAEVDYFQAFRTRLDAVLSDYFKKSSRFPENLAELRAALKAGEIEFDDLRDAWGNNYYAVFSQRFRYGDQVVISYDDLSKLNKTDIKPVTQQINLIALRSAGADGKEGTSDDFTTAEFARLATEMSSFDQKPQPVSGSVPQLAAMGAIKGAVIDANGAAIAGATIKAANVGTQQSFEQRTNNNGEFLLRNLPAGLYRLECSSPGFMRLIVTDIRVLSSTITNVNLTLQVASVSETVEISASVVQLQTESASASITSKQITNLPLNGRNALNLAAMKPGVQITTKSETSTPRLREHFQETLVWQPQLETDKQGRAQLKFKLADNITTWKMTVIGSTVDGQIGFAEKEFLAFQPFFAEHDPPRVLTEGDEIALPVVLRNYLNKSQRVTTEMKPENWFTLLGAARQQTNVAAGDAAKAVFDFRVTASVKEGKQRVTAIGGDASDAIEKPVSVHPDGEELAQTASGVFVNDGKLNIAVPADAIKGSVRAELKIYPNLMAHALEGIEGILHRPYGCGEQTISSTYPNVMALRYLKQQDESAAALGAKALRYVQSGYERLLGYRSTSGGFTYWGRGEADLALTAYAVRFLSDAREFIAVDDDVVAKARNWIIAAQQSDGSWQPRYYGNDKYQATLTTAYIARVLATERKRMEKPEQKLADSLQRALKYLAARSEEIDKPYLIASYALALMDAGEREETAKAINKLRCLARDEAGTAYWHLESNTPFYGWGLAGRIETTALVVKALQRDGEMRRQGDGERDELVDRGLLFLLRNKDRYGVWLSTQATINVLDALTSLYEAEKVKESAGGEADIFINGKRLNAVAMPPGNRLSAPVTIDLSQSLVAGDNRIDIRRAGSVTLATAQIVETHYAAWKAGAAEEREKIEPGKSRALRLAVGYDKPQAKIGDEVTCSVVAERIGHSGYGQFGMMLAEIGLPPGADVDRASLEAAMKDSGWELSQYDVLPDRVIVYLWPRAGGTRFSFKFKLRYGIRAQSAPSVLYDYYNPEARTVIAPTRFVAK